MKASAWNSLKERKTVPAGPTTPCTGGAQITRLLGVVKSYSALRRYGFLNCADCEQDIWFSKADVVAGDRTVQVGLTVQFEMYRATRGQPRARRIQVDDPCTATEAKEHLTSGYVKFHHNDWDHCLLSCKHIDGVVWLSKEDINPQQWVFLKVGVPVNFELVLTGRMPRAHKAEVSLLPSRLGRVKRYSEISRCGFITCDDIWEDVWFAGPTVVKEPAQPISAGTRVHVDLFRTHDWKLRACRVQRVADEAKEITC